jgi:hypothetical protein
MELPAVCNASYKRAAPSFCRVLTVCSPAMLNDILAAPYRAVGSKGEIMRKMVFWAAVLVLVSAPLLPAGDISGNWVLKMQGPMGEEEIQLVIKVSGEKLKVTGTHSMLEEMTGSGTLKGDLIKFKLDASGDMPMGFEFTGKVDGNKMSGTREMKMAGGMGGPGGEGGMGPGGEGGPGGGPMDTSQISNKWTAEKQ